MRLLIDERPDRTIPAVLDRFDPAAVSTWQRYLLFQIPGWLIAAAVAVVLSRLGVESSLCAVAWSVWVFKDFALYPLLRGAYERDHKTGAQALVGARGFAQENLAPTGFVRVRGELWSASALPADRMISAGDEIEIIGAERMTVIVRRVDRIREPISQEKT